MIYYQEISDDKFTANVMNSVHLAMDSTDMFVTGSGIFFCRNFSEVIQRRSR